MNIIKDIEIAMFDVLNSDRYSTFRQYYYNNPKQEEELLVRIYNLIKKKGEGIAFASYAIEKKEGNTTSSGAKRQIYLLGNSEKELECAIVFKLLSNKLKRYVNKHMVSRDTQIEILIEKLKVPNIKQIYSCDITDFYGSIDHGKLKEIVNSKLDLQVYIDLFNDYLDFSSDLLDGDVQSNSLLEKPNEIDGKSGGLGIPQGLSPSNLLAELYAIHIKNKMEMLLLKDEVDASVYRYADDFRIVFFSEIKEKKLIEIIQKIEKEFCIIFRNAKTAALLSQGKELKGELTKWEVTSSFDYLGYKFIYEEGEVTLQISEKKLEKIKNRVLFTLEQYQKEIFPIRTEFDNGMITLEELKERMNPYKKKFDERIKNVVSVKIFKKGKNTIHTGAAYTYRQISDDANSRGKIISFKINEESKYINKVIEMVEDDMFPIEVNNKKIEVTLLTNKKLFYIDKPNYINKHQLILTVISLGRKQYTIQELKNKTYYEVYSLYQEALRSRKILNQNKRYVNKKTLILKLLKLNSKKQYIYQDLRDKTYYEVYSLYQEILWN